METCLSVCLVMETCPSVCLVAYVLLVSLSSFFLSFA